mmetsp:Transcript_87624/g.256173  ORF Transcript_87624/g.256173 Transcript_87624/m.256173 type:complete len:930 (+) Transcript_87624:162-2951(+)
MAGAAMPRAWHFLTLACCCGAVRNATLGTDSLAAAGGVEDDSSGLIQRPGHRPDSTLQAGAEAMPEAAAAGVGMRRKLGCKRRHGTARRHAAAREQGPTLDASTIRKYVTPLVIPPVMRKSARCKLPQAHCPPLYEIAVRQFEQQILPGGHWNSKIWGILKQPLPADETYNSTTVWSYGPASDPKPDSSGLEGGAVGLAPAGNSQFNYPAYTVENVRDVPTEVTWINNLVKNPWKCNWWAPWTTKEACRFIEHLVPIDQSLHWANPERLPCSDEAKKKKDCRPVEVRDPRLAEPYLGPVPMVVHVHGAHASSDSDGYPEAWWMPTASDLEGFAKRGSAVNRLGRRTNWLDGAAHFRYANDQPSTTMWYHDHTLGMTRANVYAGAAGFWLLRERQGGETGLVRGRLPGPAPQPGETLEQTNLKGRHKYHEIPLVIQDRSFNKDGTLFYPRDRAFFEKVDPENLQVPLIGNTSVDSDIPPIWNPEAFFDVMLVNGVSWPVLQVKRALYRFRVLNGCSSRFLNLALCVVSASGSPCPMDGNGKPRVELDFYQIGGDQSLLPKVVRVSTGFKTRLPGNGTLPKKQRPTASPREALLLGPAERADVLVDFRKLARGTVVRMTNTGPDEPFGGFTDDFVMADASTTGQVMEFHVLHEDKHGVERATSPEDLVLSLPDKRDPANLIRHLEQCKWQRRSPELGGKPWRHCPAKVRDLALLEEESKLICATREGDAIVWDPSSKPDPENPGTCVQKLGASVTAAPRDSQPALWTLLGTKAGLGRAGAGPSAGPTPFGPTAALLGIQGSTVHPVSKLWADTITERPKKGSTEIWELWNWSEDAHPIHLHLVKFKVLQRVGFDDSDASLGDEVADVPTEAGWKDTVIAYPGEVTRVAATFDLAGLYVWHCHILEHEDNEMMRPYCVVGKDGFKAACGAAL